jgi:CBS domain-containing protein
MRRDGEIVSVANAAARRRRTIAWHAICTLRSLPDISFCLHCASCYRQLRAQLSEHCMNKISEVMTREIRVARPDQTIREAALTMAREDIGSLPVGENDKLIGMITDRDIVLRAVAEGRSPDTPVREVMTDDIKYCYDDDDVAHVAQNMAELQVRRLPVVNRDKRLVGIVALSNVAHCGDGHATEEMLRGVATPH